MYQHDDYFQKNVCMSNVAGAIMHLIGTAKIFETDSTPIDFVENVARFIPQIFQLQWCTGFVRKTVTNITVGDNFIAAASTAAAVDAVMKRHSDLL